MSEFPDHLNETRGRYPYLTSLASRWNDLDLFGHVNNAIYYEYFDSAINRYLMEVGGNDPLTDGTMQFCVENRCRYYREMGFPERITVGLRVAKLGKTSVGYDLALFAEGRNEPSALGHFVHVFVDRANRRPVAIPAALRDALARLLGDT
ncbi:MAG: thioesterase [Planctomycetaceae bacterium]|nr:thioesterase [Planctomycetaceae bacterium]|tara:strand:- start:2433 stop:2882 length:450 start_codon:yes stop_codon:yes gene_type:complete